MEYVLLDVSLKQANTTLQIYNFSRRSRWLAKTQTLGKLASVKNSINRKIVHNKFTHNPEQDAQV